MSLCGVERGEVQGRFRRRPPSSRNRRPKPVLTRQTFPTESGTLMISYRRPSSSYPGDIKDRVATAPERIGEIDSMSSAKRPRSSTPRVWKPSITAHRSPYQRNIEAAPSSRQVLCADWSLPVVEPLPLTVRPDPMPVQKCHLVHVELDSGSCPAASSPLAFGILTLGHGIRIHHAGCFAASTRRHRVTCELACWGLHKAHRRPLEPPLLRLPCALLSSNRRHLIAWTLAMALGLLRARSSRIATSFRRTQVSCVFPPVPFSRGFLGLLGFPELSLR